VHSGTYDPRRRSRSRASELRERTRIGLKRRSSAIAADGKTSIRSRANAERVERPRRRGLYSRIDFGAGVNAQAARLEVRRGGRN